MRKTVFGIPFEFYRTGKISMPVEFPFCKALWQGVYGLQFGDVFIGLIKGRISDEK